MIMGITSKQIVAKGILLLKLNNIENTTENIKRLPRNKKVCPKTSESEESMSCLKKKRGLT